MRELERPPQDLAEYGRLQPYVVPGQYPEMEAAQPAVSPTHYLLVIWRQRWKIIAFVAACLMATYLISVADHAYLRSHRQNRCGPAC